MIADRTSSCYLNLYFSTTTTTTTRKKEFLGSHVTTSKKMLCTNMFVVPVPRK